MKTKTLFLSFISILLLIGGCTKKNIQSDMNIIFLHHSTGGLIWYGNKNTFAAKAARRISAKYSNYLSAKAQLPTSFKKYNKLNNKNYIIEEMIFPKGTPYGWSNFPYDYYNIWVKNGGEEPFLKEPTLEILTRKYQVIIFKHCFPVSNIGSDAETSDIDSNQKTLSNYKLQYSALREKLHEFPNTKFILFTGAVHVKSNISEENALRAFEFFNWVITEWDIPDDNIFIWNLYNLETEGGIYLKDEFAVSESNSHPNKKFSEKASDLLFNRIIDIIENNGETTSLTGLKE